MAVLGFSWISPDFLKLSATVLAVLTFSAIFLAFLGLHRFSLILCDLFSLSLIFFDVLAFSWIRREQRRRRSPRPSATSLQPFWTFQFLPTFVQLVLAANLAAGPGCWSWLLVLAAGLAAGPGCWSWLLVWLLLAAKG